MICLSCIHGVVQKSNVGDLDFTGKSVLREIFNCDLISKEMVKLVECSRYGEIKKVEVKIEPVIVDLGYGAIPKKKGWPLGKKRKVKDAVK